MFAKHVDVDETGDIAMAMGRPKAELMLNEDERSRAIAVKACEENVEHA